MTPRIYRVGGCVRDTMLRREGFDVATSDTDWVVVGATPEWMIKQGFFPVGADFPVFLHPETHEEYALARTERKTAKGYHGFKFYAQSDVTIEEDLRRRDLTINAMAMDEAGNVIDPYGGQADIRARLLRHVSDAFAEDPVRILRLARFAARFPEFKVAQDTNDLARTMVENGETDALVAERVFKEFTRGFAERSPRRMLEVLRDCGYWERIFPDIVVDETLLSLLDRASKLPDHGDIVLALIFALNQKADVVPSRMKALRADSVTASLCEVLARELTRLTQAQSARDYTDLFSQADVLRRPERFDRLTVIAKVVNPEIDEKRLEIARKAFVGVNASEVARSQSEPGLIPVALAKARLEAVEKALSH